MAHPIQGLSSLLIDVLDRERSLRFYQGVLGLPVVDEVDDGHVTVFALDPPTSRGGVAMTRDPDGRSIGLIRPTPPAG